VVLLRHPLRWRRATQERRITSNGSWLGAARRAAAGIHLGGPDLEQTARRHMRLVGARLPFTTRYRNLNRPPVNGGRRKKPLGT